MRKYLTGFVLLALAGFASLALNSAVTIAQNSPSPSANGPLLTKYGTATDTTAVTMLAAPGTGVRNYVYEAMCTNTSTTADVALIKTGSTVLAPIPCPIGNGRMIRFDPPLPQTSTATALTMTAGSGQTTLYFYMAGRTAR